MDIVSSDWHFGDGSERDRGDREKANYVVNTVCELGVKTLYLAGDIFERLKFNWDDIVKANTLHLTTVGHNLTIAGVHVVILPGNHDESRISRTIAWLQNTCGWSITGASPFVIAGRWRIEHGHRFDFPCKRPFSYVSRTFTWITANTVELIFPKMDEGWASPVEWFSPAENDKRAGAVGELAEEWADKNQEHLIMGHTHRHAYKAGRDWEYFNAGACTIESPRSYVQFEGEYATLVTERS